MRNRGQKQRMWQLVSLISVVGITAWGIVILWFYFSRPNVIHVDSAIPLISLAFALVLILPFNVFRIRWSYLASALPLVGLVILGIVRLLEANQLALTVRTAVSIVMVLVAFVGCISSLLAFGGRGGKKWWKAIVSVVAIVAVLAVSFVLLARNAGAIQRLQATWTQNRIEKRLAALDSLDEKIHFLQKEGGLPTLSAGIVVGDELAWNRTYGEQAGANPTFNIGSITKPIVATAVMQLVEQNLLSLDADVSEYLPFTLRHPDAPGTPITIRMLLTHQSGLSHFTAQYASYTTGQPILEWAGDTFGQTIYGEITAFEPRPELGDFLASCLLEDGDHYSDNVWSATPGQRYVYSTPGYDLLGFIVSQVTGMEFEEYLRENLFAVLGMSSTGLAMDQAPERRAIPYDLESGILYEARVRMPLYDRPIIGGGGITSTVRDLSRFMIAHLHGGRVGGAQMLAEESVVAMRLLRVSSTADIGMAGYGYGLNIMRDEPWEYYGHSYDFQGSIGHGGKDYGYMSRLFFVPSEKGGYGAIILTNRSDFLDSNITWFFATMLRIENLLMEEAASQHDELPDPTT